MSIEKIKDDQVVLAKAVKGKKPQDAADTIPDEQMRMLSLEVVDDDLGGDPYNRTGTFCQIALKNREQ